MRKNWLGRNIDLNMLTEYLGDFLKTCDFEAIKGETENGYHILAQNSPRYKFGGCVSVAIEGKPEEFSIELELSGKNARKDPIYPVMAVALLGGGYFISRALKSRDEWMRFERDFWEHVDKVIDCLNTE